MKILVVGAGGVGAAFAAIASRRSFFEQLVLADIDVTRAQRTVDRLGDPRVTAIALDASDATSSPIAVLIDADNGIRAVADGERIVNASRPRAPGS